MMSVGLEPTNPEDHGLNVARLTTSLRLRYFERKADDGDRTRNP